jgi:hypothetical protein
MCRFHQEAEVLKMKQLTNGGKIGGKDLPPLIIGVPSGTTLPIKTGSGGNRTNKTCLQILEVQADKEPEVMLEAKEMEVHKEIQAALTIQAVELQLQELVEALEMSNQQETLLALLQVMAVELEMCLAAKYQLEDKAVETVRHSQMVDQLKELVKAQVMARPTMVMDQVLQVLVTDLDNQQLEVMAKQLEKAMVKAADKFQMEALVLQDQEEAMQMLLQVMVDLEVLLEMAKAEDKLTMVPMVTKLLQVELVVEPQTPQDKVQLLRDRVQVKVQLPQEMEESVSVALVVAVLVYQALAQLRDRDQDQAKLQLEVHQEQVEALQVQVHLYQVHQVQVH